MSNNRNRDAGPVSRVSFSRPRVLESYRFKPGPGKPRKPAGAPMTIGTTVMKNSQDPHDPRLNRSGNRLFRNAAQQRQRKPNFSWTKVAIAVTVLFTSAGATFYYMGKGESPAPAAQVSHLPD